jgi:dTDP-4-dehydrorhamnose 3,5-epimerase
MEKVQTFNSPSFIDNRGSFTPLSLEMFNKKWIQSNVSINTKTDTFRGLHYQKEEFAQAKLVKVIKGSIIDYVVDLREDSDDYMRLQSFEINENNAILVPRGYAHGFITTEDDTVVQYLVDNVYSKESEKTLFWTDVNELKHLLGPKKLIISEKDNPVRF